MADNVDHNPATLDGKGSLHAMGVISATTTKTGLHNLGTVPIPRQKIKKVAAVTLNKGIPIIPYIPANKTGLSTVKFKNLLELKPENVLPPTYYLNILWHSSYLFTKTKRPSWSGYMSNHISGDHSGVATVSFFTNYRFKSK